MATSSGKVHLSVILPFLLCLSYAQRHCSSASMVTKGYGDLVIQHDPKSICTYVNEVGRCHLGTPDNIPHAYSPQVNPTQWSAPQFQEA